MPKQVLSAALAATLVLGAGSLQHAFAAVDPSVPTHVIGFRVVCPLGEGCQGGASGSYYSEDGLVQATECYLKDASGSIVYSRETVTAIQKEVSEKTEEIQKSGQDSSIKVAVDDNDHWTVTVVPHTEGCDVAVEMGHETPLAPKFEADKPTYLVGIALKVSDTEEHTLITGEVLTVAEIVDLLKLVPGLDEGQRQQFTDAVFNFIAYGQQTGTPHSMKMSVFRGQDGTVLPNMRVVSHESGADIASEMANAPTI